MRSDYCIENDIAGQQELSAIERELNDKYAEENKKLTKRVKELENEVDGLKTALHEEGGYQVLAMSLKAKVEELEKENARKDEELKITRWLTKRMYWDCTLQEFYSG
jgi:Skp family chaperone for outer membrane proteins